MPVVPRNGTVRAGCGGRELAFRFMCLVFEGVARQWPPVARRLHSPCIRRTGRTTGKTLSANAASIVAIAAPPKIGPASVKNGAASFTSVLAQLALVAQAGLRAAPIAPEAVAAASPAQAPPQKPNCKPRHPASQPTPPVAAAAGQALATAPSVAPAAQAALVAPTGAETDADGAEDDTIGGPDAESRAGPSAAANRHQAATTEADEPDDAPTPPSRVAQGPYAAAAIAASTPQAAPHTAAVTPGAAGLVASIAGFAATGAPSSSSPAASAPVTAPPTAATQLAHATAIHIAAGSSGQITIHLQPAELGAVQVRIERGHAGTATITVQVERADTLHALQVDLPHLHQALDRAGVPAEARQVTVELAQAPPPTNSAGAGAGGDGQRQGQAPRAKPHSAAAGDQDETAEPIQRWRPAGINITA